MLRAHLVEGWPVTEAVAPMAIRGQRFIWPRRRSSSWAWWGLRLPAMTAYPADWAPSQTGPGPADNISTILAWTHEDNWAAYDLLTWSRHR
jgi:hypothetical protein